VLLTGLDIDPWRSLAGGALLGAGAAVLILTNGRVAGISGIVGRVLQGSWGPGGWHVAFLCGLLLPALIFGPGNAVFESGPLTLAFIAVAMLTVYAMKQAHWP
jgi:uncharacterized protein